jgi:hypothetical protein
VARVKAASVIAIAARVRRVKVASATVTTVRAVRAKTVYKGDLRYV